MNRTKAAAGICAVMFGLVGCAADASTEDAATSEGALQAQLDAKSALRCDAGDQRLALVAEKGGKVALVALAPAGDVYALSGTTGALTSSASKWSWKGAKSSLDVGSDMKGTWKRGAQSTAVTCKMAGAEAASWRVANALVGYAGEIDGLADAVLENDEKAKHPKPYTVFAIETSKRSTLDVGTNAKDSTGALPGSDDAESRLDEIDLSHGAMSAAYALGGGDDYGEWFQGASDGISLVGDVGPALGAGARAGFIAHEKVASLAKLVDDAKPSAVEITVGTWTFYLPDAFPK